MSLVAALLLGLVLPTIAGCVLLSGATGDESRPAADVVLARGLACGLGAWLLGSGVLTRTVGLTATWSWAWDGLVAAASVVVLLLPRYRGRLGGACGPALRRFAEVTVVGAVVFVPLGWVIASTTWSPLGSTPWYYYGLARQVAEAGSIPSTSVEFGAATPFLNDYHLFTTGTAMLLTQYGGGPITVVNTVALLSALFLALGMTALTSTLGAGRVAALCSVPIALAVGIGPQRLVAYRAEGFALGLAVLLAALGIDWLRSGDRRSLIGAVVLAATLSQVHGIAALTGGVMVTAAALVLVLRGPRRRQLVRAAFALGALLLGVLVVGLVFREASGTVHAGGLADRGGIADPTWEFFRAARDRPPSVPPSNWALVQVTLKVLYDWQKWWFVPVLVLALVGLWRARRQPPAREVVGFTLLSLLGLGVVAAVFALGWQGYVPRRTGASRLIADMSLLGPPLVAIGLEGLIAGGSALPRTGPSRPARGPRAVLAVVLVLLTALGLKTMTRFGDYFDGQRPTRAQLAVWQAIPATSSDVILSNAYTEGFIPDTTGAAGLLDGRAPYTFADQLARANRLFREAADFYDDPASHWSFLAANHVTWVVVGDRGTHSLGTGNMWSTPADPGVLRACSGLRQTASTEGLTVFKVVDPSAGGCS